MSCLVAYSFSISFTYSIISSLFATATPPAACLKEPLVLAFEGLKIVFEASLLNFGLDLDSIV